MPREKFNSLRRVGSARLIESELGVNTPSGKGFTVFGRKRSAFSEIPVHESLKKKCR
jgi:hypothetical protein